MFKNSIPVWIYLLGTFFLISGCAEAPIKVGEGKIEPTLQQVTGLSENAADTAATKAQMSLWDVYALAAKRTEILATSAENVLQAKAQSNQAVGAWLPQIGLNGTLSGYSNSTTPPGLYPNLNNDSLYFSAAETILTGLNQVAAIQGASDNINAQQFSLQNQARTLLLNVASAFYNVLSLEESLQALQASRDLNAKTLDIEKEWQRMGRARTADVSNTQAQLAQLDADIQSTQNQLTQARSQLSTLANLKLDQPLISEETFSAPPTSLDDAESGLENRPDVKSAASSVAVADAELLAAHGGHLPNLIATGQYFVDRDGGSAAPDWNVQLTASLPIFEGGQVIAEEDQAASKMRQAEMVLSLTKRTAHDDIQNALKSLTESTSETDAYQKAEQSYEQAYQDVMHDYKLNLTTNLELLQTMTSLENTKISYIKAKYQTLYDQVWLGVATGQLPKISQENK